MKTFNMWAAGVMVVACAGAASAQPKIDWYTIDGGGGRSTGGNLVLTGTIGQPDAGRMTGGNLVLQGGFWPGPSTASKCSPADIADDAGNAPPVGVNNGVNEGDYNAFFNNFFTNQAVGSPADIAYDNGDPLPPFGTGSANNGVNEGDYNCFFNTFFSGCVV